jgi:hypothetical protein
MLLGLSLPEFTLLHVSLSLIGIAAGVVTATGMFWARPMERATALFLVTTVLTSVTGFMFPSAGFTPAMGVGILSLALLAVALLALYALLLRGSWRWIYVGTAVAALYLNAFVAVVQAFQKIHLLKALAPTQTEAVFIVTQIVLMLAFIALGTAAAFRFHPERNPPDESCLDETESESAMG